MSDIKKELNELKERLAELEAKVKEDADPKPFDIAIYRATILAEAAERAVAWYRQGQIIPAHKESYAIKQLRAAIMEAEQETH